MENLRADLHLHTYYSDGLLSPAEIVREAKNNGVGLFAITDHDCALAFSEVKPIADNAGLKTVAGIEVSAYVGDVKIHTLGYGIDENCGLFKKFLKELYEGSLKRADDIISKLNKNGVAVTLEEVRAFAHSPLSPVHSMHIAYTCAKKGYAEGNPFAFFNNYLAYGRCAYSCICRPEPERTVEIINACGGFSSLAHPGRIDMPAGQLKALVKKLTNCGLGGIEAVYSAHTVTETAYYKEMAKAYGLIVTGGSDTHLIGRNRRVGTPVFYADETLLGKLGI